MPSSGDRFEGAKESLRACLARIAPRFGLTAAAVRALTESGRSIHPHEGDRICRSDARGASLHLVVAGVVKIVVHAPEGGDIIERLLGPGDPFCLLPRTEDGTWSEAIAHVDSTVTAFDHASLLAVLTNLPPENLAELIGALWRELSVAAQEKALLLGMDLPERLVFELRLLARRFGIADPEGGGTLIDVQLAHRELAALVAATRPNVTRQLATLTRDRIIAGSTAPFVVVNAVRGKAAAGVPTLRG